MAQVNSTTLIDEPVPAIIRPGRPSKANGHSNGHTSGHSQAVAPAKIVKRDGRVVDFDTPKIEVALTKCFDNIEKDPATPIAELTRQVVNIVASKYAQPTVEQVQDIVEMVLQAAGEFDAAKHYILYRAEHAKARVERPIPEAVKKAFEEDEKYFPTPIQKFQFYDKYSRFNYDLGRRETWVETVDRAVDFLKELSNSALPSATYERIKRSVLEMKSAPSMRLLAMAGNAARRQNISIYNCSYLPADSLDSFVEALIISMAGCGVGFSVEGVYVEKLPRVKRQTGGPKIKYIIQDSAEGWADALRLALNAWFNGEDVDLDFSQLRPAGAPLKTKGGRASGPEPFKKMLDFVRARILTRAGGLIRPIDAHDIMCAVGNAAVSGGVRRTAMISLFDYEDTEMRFAKHGDFERENNQRWNANNSIVWPQHEINQAEFTHLFMDMIDSGRGEPGFFNRTAAQQMSPARRTKVDFGTNPCHRGTNLVHTTSGLVPIKDLVGRDFSVITPTGEIAPAVAFPTGVKNLFRVHLDNGIEIDLTENHRLVMLDGTKCEVNKLQLGDQILLSQHEIAPEQPQYDFSEEEGILLGWNSGDGWITYHKNVKVQAYQVGFVFAQADRDMVHWTEQQLTRHIPKNGPKLKNRPDKGVFELATTNKQFTRYFRSILGGQHKSQGVPLQVMQGNRKFQRGYLRGLFSADGHVERKNPSTVYNGTRRIRLVSAHEKLVRDVQILLSTFGIFSSLHHSVSRLPGRPKQYERWQLDINSTSFNKFVVKIGFLRGSSKQKEAEEVAGRQWRTLRISPNARVVSVVPLGVSEEVYNLTVDHPLHEFAVNGLISANCGEIILRPYEFCNLSIAVARKEDNYESLKEKVEVATIIGTIQSMATNFPGLRPMWQKNCEEERLLGVDINGQLDSPICWDRDVKERLLHVTLETNREIAATLGINPSVSVTCVKPSGNSSQLFNCSSGIHARWAPYYIRNVRVAAHSPVYKALRDAGVPMDSENGQTIENANTYVVHFPMKAPEGAITRNDRTAIQQCEFWLQNKLHWTEHNPSVTITYQPNEVLGLMKWVWEHKDILGGITFLPASDAKYDQMPYQEITKEDYEEKLAKFPAIDFSKLYRYEEEDLTKAAQEIACMAGACEIEYVPQGGVNHKEVPIGSVE